ncbi:putative disease resistance protein RGA1 [Bienertia sinuspersici]
MVEIGEKIVAKCNNNPLAIKVLGSLLYGQDIRKWRCFEESGLAEIHNDENTIMFVLKLSYHNLPSSLKSCFSYCAVFPKDFCIKRMMLIDLWMAQGYIKPLDGCQSIEDAAEKHFSILLQRRFFQDVKKDEYNNVVSVKIHDLMHDVALEVGGKEIQFWSFEAKIIGDKIRHLSSFSGIYQKSLLLREFPHDFSKLIQLRHLDVSNCFKLTSMPLGMDKLTSLKVLTEFLVGKKSLCHRQCDDELKNLGTFTNLTGSI